MSWVPSTAPDGDVHTVVVLGVKAFPPARSSISRAAIQRAFRRAGLKAKGPVVPVGIDVTADDGTVTTMVLIMAPVIAAGLVAAIESAEVIDRRAVHAARAQLAHAPARPV